MGEFFVCKFSVWEFMRVQCLGVHYIRVQCRQFNVESSPFKKLDEEEDSMRIENSSEFAGFRVCIIYSIRDTGLRRNSPVPRRSKT